MKVSVVGSGGWGTALALVLLENGSEVTMWSYSKEESDILKQTGENPMLKGVPLPKGLNLTTDLSCVKGCKAVILATFVCSAWDGSENGSDAGPWYGGCPCFQRN